jgi:lipid-binding SYLF domain-containing protein
MAARRIAIFLLALVGAALACSTPKGGSVEEKRSYVRKMRNDTLREAFAIQPELEKKLASAPGYAVFSNLSTKLFIVGGGHGYGLAVDNQDGGETFMRMAELGVGVGLGLKDFRAVFVFRDRQTLDAFVTRGWQFGGTADAAAKAGDKGAAADVHAKVVESGASVGGVGQASTSGTDLTAGAGIEVYQFTQSGLALSASVAGTKYWRDGELN